MAARDRAILDQLTLWIDQCYEWKLYDLARVISNERAFLLPECGDITLTEAIRRYQRRTSPVTLSQRES